MTFGRALTVHIKAGLEVIQRVENKEKRWVAPETKGWPFSGAKASTVNVKWVHRAEARAFSWSHEAIGTGAVGEQTR